MLAFDQRPGRVIKKKDFYYTSSVPISKVIQRGLDETYEKKKLFYIEFGEVGITLAGLPSSSKLGLSWVWAGRVPRAPMQVIEIFFFF